MFFVSQGKRVDDSIIKKIKSDVSRAAQDNVQHCLKGRKMDLLLVWLILWKERLGKSMIICLST